MAADTNTTSDLNGTTRPEGTSPSEKTSRAAPQPLPTLEEIHRAIPPTGIKISDFTALFEARTPAEESFRTLLLLASVVARFDYNEMIMWPKSRPTREEARAAIKENGIRFEEFMELFGWNNLSEEKRELISYCLDQIALPDMATRTIRLRGSLTAEELLAAIPDEGITKSELEFKDQGAQKPHSRGVLEGHEGSIRSGSIGRVHREDIQTRHHCMMLWAGMSHWTGNSYLAKGMHKSDFTKTGHAKRSTDERQRILARLAANIMFLFGYDVIAWAQTEIAGQR